jgi:ribosomal protein S27E
MSIRAFANIPCAQCGKDTLHYVCKCSVCGSIFETPTEARARMRKHRHAKMGGNRLLMGQSMAVHTREKREYEKANGISKRSLPDMK